MNKYNNLLYTDTTFIINKYGNELVNYNPQIKKYKTTKISIIIDNFKNQLSVGIYKSTAHDSTIINNQLDALLSESPMLFDNTKTLVGDSAYDSNALEQKISNINLGSLIRCRNKRKSKHLCNNLSLKDKVILKQRIKVDHTMAIYKQYNRLCIRYDKSRICFLNYVYLASLILIKYI